MAAIPQWQNGVVAIGARKSDAAELKGTGWLVDVPAGIICTCAHVVMDCYPHSASPQYLDASSHGVAVGVGIGEQIRWYCRAKLLYISLWSTDGGYPHGLPDHWSRPGDEDRLDLAVLQLCNWDGSQLAPALSGPASAPWHRAEEQAIALPLGRSASLIDGGELILLGYGQGKDMGVGDRRTSTTCRGHFCGQHSKADSGDWLEAGITIYRYAGLRTWHVRRTPKLTACILIGSRFKIQWSQRRSRAQHTW